MSCLRQLRPFGNTWKEMSAAFKGLILQHHLIGCYFFSSILQNTKLISRIEKGPNESHWVGRHFVQLYNCFIFLCIWRKFNSLKNFLSQFWLNDSEQVSLFWKDMTSDIFFFSSFWSFFTSHRLSWKPFCTHVIFVPRSFQPSIHFVMACIYFLLLSGYSLTLFVILFTLCIFQQARSSPVVQFSSTV